MNEELVIRPTDADVARLWEVNPGARLQLQNITLMRMVVELRARLEVLGPPALPPVAG